MQSGDCHCSSHRIPGRLETKRQTINAPRDVSCDDYLNASLTDPAEAAAYLDAVMELDDHTARRLAL